MVKNSPIFKSENEIKSFLIELFDAAIASSDPHFTMPAYLPKPPLGRTIVVGAGKAACQMVSVLEAFWPKTLEGLVIVPYGYTKKQSSKIRIAEAGHPIPDSAGNSATHQILELVSGASEDDLVICLISGGSSSLLSLPCPGVTADEKAQIHTSLLKCGADISEINCVRRHLSAVKDGRLAVAASPAQVLTFLISDVPGDDPSIIGSGPTIPDGTKFEDAASVLVKYGIDKPEAAISQLNEGKITPPDPKAPCFARQSYQVLATPQMALEAAAELAKERGINPLILGNAIEGEAREVAKVMAGIAKQVRTFNQPVASPAVLLSGGETTVTVNGEGVGGRNSEFQLALALKLSHCEGIYSLAADTDGIDGNGHNAGAFVSPCTLENATMKSMNAADYLKNNNAMKFFEGLNDLYITGPTQTNVNDFRAILVLPKNIS